MLSRIAHLLEIYRVQFKNNWVREVVYRTNFLTMVIVDLVWIFVEFALFSVIYSNLPMDRLAGWTLEQVYFFLGMFFASDALFSILFQRSFWQFSDLVNKGELDILLTKPVSPLFLALTRWIGLTSFFNVGLGIAILIKYGPVAGFAGGLAWFKVVLWLFVGVAAQFFLRFGFSVWVFWTDRGWALARLYFQFYAIATKPDSFYPPVFRYLILTALPFGFIGSVPARAVLHGLSFGESVATATVLLGLFFFCRHFWRRGLLRYQSASS